MPVPSSIDDLDVVASNNSPAGSEPVLPNLDNYLRALSSFIAQVNEALDDKADSGDAMPQGAIVMWSGAVASIPAGWQLCNGSNGSPDLRNRFVVGAGSTYAVGGTGGSADAITVSHSHPFSDSGSTGSGGAHDHFAFNDDSVGSGTALGASTIAVRDRTGGGEGNYNIRGSATAASIGLTSEEGAHTHTFSVSGTTDSAGSSGTNANLPPYYALCFIYKL